MTCFGMLLVSRKSKLQKQLNPPSSKMEIRILFTDCYAFLSELVLGI